MPEVFVDPDQLQQIVVNLMVNANQALQEDRGQARDPKSARSRGRDGRRAWWSTTTGRAFAGVARRDLRSVLHDEAAGRRHRYRACRSRAAWRKSQGGAAWAGQNPAGRRGVRTDPAAGDRATARGRSRTPAEEASAPGRRAAALRAIIIDDELEIAKLIAEASSPAATAATWPAAAPRRRR